MDSLKILPRRLSQWAPWIILTGLFALFLSDQLALYFSKFYAFHDLTLINDFFASTVWQGKPFRVNELGINHLSWHFTPGFFLVAPLYRVFESQQLLLWWSTVAFFAGGCVLMSLAAGVLPRERGSKRHEWIRALVLSLFAVLIVMGRYSRNVLYSGHYETFYLPFAALTLVFLIREKPLAWILPVYLLSLGSREDAGIFLGFQMFSLYWLPAHWIGDRKRLLRRVLVLGAFGMLWTVVSVKVVFPLLGMDQRWHAQRLWSRYGDSFEQIGVYFLLHPWVPLVETWNSAFGRLNLSVLGLAWINPMMGLLTNLPGLIFYTTESPERKELIYYTSAFLLPGLFLSALVGVDTLYRLWRSRSTRKLRYLAPAALLIAVISASVQLGRLPGNLRRDPVAILAGKEQCERVGEWLSRCPGLRDVASDFKTVAFVPNHYAKFLLDHYRKAEAVIFDPNETALLSGHGSLGLFATAIRADKDFREVPGQTGLLTFVRKGSPCEAY